MNRHEVTVDGRGRIPLTFRVHTEHRFYVAEESEDGIITLIPAALVPAVRLPRKDAPRGVLEGAIGTIDDIREKVREIPLWGKE